jgi:uncharacterized repeat protein (TIGR03803 family)
MHSTQHRNRFTTVVLRALSTAVLTVGVVMLLSSLSAPAAAQTFQVLHNFTGGGDGGSPPFTLEMDRGGHLIGTASQGGQNGSGVVFKFSHNSSGWVLLPLYNFSGQEGQPGYGVTLAPDGSIYTTASYNSVFGGPCGTAMNLRPPASAPRSVLAPWSETVLRTYVKREEGCPTGNLVLDQAGNVYGATQSGGANGYGSIFELSPSPSGWTETVLYSFQGENDGGNPYAGLIFDNAGNLYGTTHSKGANGWGTVYELSPSGSGWTLKVLYAFQGGNDGAYPVAGVIFDNSGNLYGATTQNGVNGGGTVFELSPSGGSWNLSVLANFTGTDGPVASLTFDASGNLYGTTFMDDPAGYGSVFKLTPSGNGWTNTDLHDFTGGSDGGYPGGGVTVDANGNLYGTAVLGGANGFGVIWEITQ